MGIGTLAQFSVASPAETEILRSADPIPIGWLRQFDGYRSPVKDPTPRKGGTSGRKEERDVVVHETFRDASVVAAASRGGQKPQ